MSLEEPERIEEIYTYMNKFKGGHSIYLDVSNSTIKNFLDITNKVSKKANFFKYYCKLNVFIACASKNVYNTEKCSNCNSTSLQEYPVR